MGSVHKVVILCCRVTTIEKTKTIKNNNGKILKNLFIHNCSKFSPSEANGITKPLIKKKTQTPNHPPSWVIPNGMKILSCIECIMGWSISPYPNRFGVSQNKWE